MRRCLSLSIEAPLTPSLSPSDGERVSVRTGEGFVWRRMRRCWFWFIEMVAVGNFKEKTIELQNLRSPTKEQADLLGISPAAMFSFTNGTPLRIGFDNYSDGHFKNLKIMKP
jgi:hypothetical protein